ncbi:hypothetical protein GOP47_0016954 [Adiantum capillus-veneris]|uniref:indole-3-glycerol-phosphate synthase n=1 Tax=Adiantum capillus-veneris TaxID=13818 RepID=A0A9D4UJE5_ADICA|nr:hypothetical protein GOP47_0016954 [Adiantum capillus-veneris]
MTRAPRGRKRCRGPTTAGRGRQQNSSVKAKQRLCLERDLPSKPKPFIGSAMAAVGLTRIAVSVSEKTTNSSVYQAAQGLQTSKALRRCETRIPKTVLMGQSLYHARHIFTEDSARSLLYASPSFRCEATAGEVGEAEVPAEKVDYQAESESREEGSTSQDILISSSDNALFKPPPEWKDWQERKKEEEMVSNQGITIRRRPPTGPPQHHVGPFEFRIQNEGNTPRNKLEEIIWNKDVEVAQMKERHPLLSILQALPNAPPSRDFIGALRRRAAETNVPALIAEVKKASPSRGVIQPNFDPVRIAQAYEDGGAACISVLTDHKYFQGDFEYLKRVRNAGVQCPLLCKEFIIDAWQLYFARLHGADAVLLIAAVLPDQDLRYMSKICKKLGIAALVEVHNARELNRVLGIDGIDLIGINNRDLETFQVDINNTVELLKGERGHTVLERNILVVGESGLFTPEDIALLQNAGVKAVLVGESLVKQDDPAAGIAGLFGKDISLSRQGELQGHFQHGANVVLLRGSFLLFL